MEYDSRIHSSCRLPDSAIDLLDEACASARVSQDLKPEAIDRIEEDLHQLDTYIEGLEVGNYSVRPGLR